MIQPQNYIKHCNNKHMTKAIIYNIYGRAGLELKAKHNQEIKERKYINLQALKEVTNKLGA